MENLRTELRAAIRNSETVEHGVEKAMTLFKKEMIEILGKVNDLPDRRNSDYSRFTRNVSVIISDIKKL